MNDLDNLTPEEKEQLESQQNRSSDFYDQIENAKNVYDNVNKIQSQLSATKAKNMADVASATSKVATGSVSTTATTATTATATTATTATATTATAATATTATAGTAATTAATAGAAATPVGWIVLAVILLIIIIIILVIFFNLMYYNVIEPVSSKYSVSEVDLVNKYDSNEKDENCEDYVAAGGICNVTNTEVEKLDELLGDEAKLTVWQKISNIWQGLFGNFLGNVSEAQAAVYLKGKVDDKLDQMTREGEEIDKNDLPLGVIVSTLAYTFSSQYLELSYKNYESSYLTYEGNDIFLDKESRVNPSNPISVLASLLNEDILTTKNPEDLQDLIDNLVYHEFYPTYLWGEVDRKCETDEETNEETCTIYMGCMKIDNDSYRLDYDKYYMYLRFGAYVSGYAVDSSSNDYKKVGTGDTQNLWGKTGVINYKSDSKHEIAFGYEYFRNLYEAYYSSDQECKLKMYAEDAVEALNDQSDGKYKYVLDGSTDTANWFFKFRDVTDGYSQINNNHEIFSDFNKYYAKADTSEEEGGNVSVKVDNTKPAGTGNFAVNYSNGESYTYQHGWIYNRFPFYRSEFQVEEGSSYDYEPDITPLEIETTIEYIDEQKDLYDEILGYDTSGYVSNRWMKSYNESGTEVFPLPSGKYRITSCYGPRDPINTPAGTTSNFHDGIDLAAEAGTPIYAWKEGVVVASENAYHGYGNYVVVKHSTSTGNVYTLYAHMSRRMAKVGDVVKVGDQLGTVGSTGYSTGAHLHFELRVGGDIWQQSTAVDPYPTLMELAGGEISGTCEVGQITITPSYPSTSGGSAKQLLCLLLKSAGFSDSAVVALMINASAESTFNPNNENSKGAYGLFQWKDTRRTLFENYVDKYYNGNYSSTEAQVSYLLHDLTGGEFGDTKDYSSLYSSLLGSGKYNKSRAIELSDLFCKTYERSRSCEGRPERKNIDALAEYVTNNCGVGSSQANTGATYNDVIKFIQELYKYVGMNKNQVDQALNKELASAWCADFLSKVMRITGAYNFVKIDTARTKDLENYFKNNTNGTIYNKNGSYVPKVGDFVFFDWSPKRSGVDHVGIVTEVIGDKFVYVHGNVKSTSWYDATKEQLANCPRGEIDGVECVIQSIESINDSDILGYGSWY